MNRCERLEPGSRAKIEKFFAKPVSALRGSDGNHEMRRTGGFDDCFQLVIRTQHRHAENIAADRFSCDNSGDLDWLGTVQSLQQIHNDTCMTAGAKAKNTYRQGIPTPGFTGAD